ncbi:hypothetical protein Nos7524_4825 [Nostoc sp. PCC 7524]|nr:hypothetical protein Nos7524_4825 [Nostoc sp. PCC 7524]
MIEKALASPPRDLLTLLIPLFVNNPIMTQNTNYQESTLKGQAITYKERLNPWAITRLLPDMQRVTVARFRSRSDADGHLQLLRQLIPDGIFTVVFDSQREEVMM